MRLTEQQLDRFRDEGVVIADGLLTDADLAPVIAEYEAWIQARAMDLQASEKLTDPGEGLDFAHRIAHLYAQAPEIVSGMDVMQVRGPALFAFLRNENLLDAVECLVGPEITCSPIQHIRAKPPAALTGDGEGFYNVPWHQDMAVTWKEADASEIVTCWLPLVDATEENGCMEVLPGVWKGGYREHYPGPGGTAIRPEAIPPEVQPRPVPVRKGGAIFMHRCTPHRSVPNRSDGVRWSLDVRFQPTGTPTGRPFHPEFVVRSRSHPETVCTDHAEWTRRWKDALDQSRGMHAHRV